MLKMQSEIPTRTKDTVELPFPVYSIGFATKNRMLVGGGGGINRNGIKNAIVSIYVSCVAWPVLHLLFLPISLLNHALEPILDILIQ
jgi:hypothetical protein